MAIAFVENIPIAASMMIVFMGLPLVAPTGAIENEIVVDEHWIYDSEPTSLYRLFDHCQA
jgi:hypothetical protein